MKIDIENVESILIQRKIDPTKVQEILRDLKVALEEEKEEKDKTPKQKWEYIIVLSDPQGELKGKELVGWVVQQKEGEVARNIIPNLQSAAGVVNSAASKKKHTITSVVDMFKHIKAKFLKDTLKIKTKDAVQVIIAQ